MNARTVARNRAVKLVCRSVTIHQYSIGYVAAAAVTLGGGDQKINATRLPKALSLPNFMLLSGSSR